MNICLYGASSPEIDPVYLDAAYAFGRLLAQHEHTLVYGGGAQGVMGAAARGAYEAGGRSPASRRHFCRWTAFCSTTAPNFS